MANNKIKNKCDKCGKLIKCIPKILKCHCPSSVESSSQAEEEAEEASITLIPTVVVEAGEEEEENDKE